MGIGALYTVSTDKIHDESSDNACGIQEVLALVESTVVQSLRGKGYTWGVIGLPLGLKSVSYGLDIYFGGENTEQWSQEDQLNDWIQSVDSSLLLLSRLGELSEPILFYFKGSEVDAMDSLQLPSTKLEWATKIDLTRA